MTPQDQGSKKFIWYDHLPLPRQKKIMFLQNQGDDLSHVVEGLDTYFMEYQGKSDEFKN